MATTPLALLAALRDHVIKGRIVEVKDDELVLVDASGAELQRFSKHSATAYQSKTTKKPYDLLAVWTCYKYAHLPFVDYVAQCRTEKATIVSSVDKRELIAYLKGDIETSTQISGAEGSAAASASASASASSTSEAAAGAKRASTGGQENGDAAAKKRKTEAARGDGNKENKTKPETVSAEAKEAESELKKVLDKEFTHRNRTSVLNAPKKSFEHVLKAVEAANVETKEKIEKASKTALVAPAAARKEQKPLGELVREKIHGTPIIVIPAGFSDLLTMLNIKDFLVDGVYVTNMQKKSEGCRKASSITITHEEDGETFTFNIVDNVTRFKEKDWRCVVGVIASGQAWQFKGWKWKFPLEVFKKVCGVHIYSQGSQLGEEIKQWDVKIMMIHPDKRHLDKVASKEFWRYLFEFLKLKALRYRLRCDASTYVIPQIEGARNIQESGERGRLRERILESATDHRSGKVAQLWNRKYQRGPSTIAVTDRDEDLNIAGQDNIKTDRDKSSADEETTGLTRRAPRAMPSSAASGGTAVSNAKPKQAAATEGPSNPLTKPPLTQIKSSSKVAPEDQPPPRPLNRKAQALAIVENKYVSSCLTLCTIFALFGDDIRVLCNKSADTPIYDLLFVSFLLFSAELAINVYALPNYFQKGLGGAFYLDFVSTISVIPDIGWIWSHVVSTTTSSTSAGQAAALKAGRASRAGTKAGRIVRLVRLFRMLRILRVVKEKDKDADVKVQISEPSKIGKVLTEKTTRRLIMLVLLIIIVSPIIDGSVDQTQDDFQVSQLERLHRYSQDYNVSGEVPQDEYRKMVEQYVRDSNGLIIQMSLVNTDSATLTKWLSEIKFQPLNSDDDWTFEGDYTLNYNPKNDWTAAKYLLNDPTTVYRSNEYTVVENYGCYKDNLCVDCSTSTTEQTCHSWVIFDVRRFYRETARLNIGKTIVVIFCFGVSIFVLTKDAETMIIGPIERMMRLVTQLAENPLGATEAKRELYELEADEKTTDDYETKMLEQTLGKIGRLLQVGFGAAGTEIIAKNMGGAGELDVMIPGKKITSLFGFGIIEHFTETCSILEEDVITYINTIAEIVHSDAKIFHGAANKNIGAAFLLAWKMCDGPLPGMRDPRDPADKPRMDPTEKAKKREGIYIKSAGSGTVARRIGPQELVDSALTAMLKMRVDLHNANHHGTLLKYCTNKKLLTAFENFEVHLGFGLHIGWAIEGAIGSKYKIDASYLSPNVNMAARLEAATGQFDVPMLISEWVVDELSPEAKKFCRKIDRVMVKGSEIPMDLWTFDIGHYPTEGLLPKILADGTQKAVEYGQDVIFKILQESIPRGFFDCFNEGIGAYFGGKWDVARDKLTAANQIWEDGPTKVVLKVMETESKGTFIAPGWWKGYRALTEK